MVTISSPKAKFRPCGNVHLRDADLYVHTQYVDMLLLVDNNNSQMERREIGRRVKERKNRKRGKRKEERRSKVGEGNKEAWSCFFLLIHNIFLCLEMPQRQ